MDTKKKMSRSIRKDGEATRIHIINAAGVLFAQQGYHATTSKAICAAARVNQAAINYHFGTQAKLYQSVLSEVHKRIVALDELLAVIKKPISPREKLTGFFKAFVPHIFNEQEWPMRLWARELLNPSPLLPKIMQEEVLPKFKIIREVVKEVTGLSNEDPALLLCMLSVVAPCLMAICMGRETAMPLAGIFNYTQEHLIEHLTTFSMAGLVAASTPAIK